MYKFLTKHDGEMKYKKIEGEKEIAFIVYDVIEVRIPKKVYYRFARKYSDKDIITYCPHKNVYNAITKRRLYYIAEENDIPIIGHTAFGLIDRGTNLIQVRPCTGCNLNCIFCSVDEGRSKTRVTDYMVDVDYLVKKFKEIADYKREKCKDIRIEAHIDGQGEPFLYPYIKELIKRLHGIADIVSTQTNGTLLTNKDIGELEKYLDRINLSINSLDERKASLLAGNPSYNLNHVVNLAKEIANSEIDLLIAPVWLPGYNDEDIREIVKFGKEIGAGKKWKALGIQKYIRYRFGRNPKGVKPMSFKRFYQELERMGKGLRLYPQDFGIVRCREIPRKFRVGERLRVKIEMHGRIRGEMLAFARDRVIQVTDTNKGIGDFVDVEMVRNRHNIYVAKEIK